MAENLPFQLHLKSPAGGWQSRAFENLPVERPCNVTIECNHPQATDAARQLADAVADVLTTKLGAVQVAPPEGRDPQQSSEDENLLLVVVCDGVHPAKATSGMKTVLGRADGGWVMPVMAKGADAKLLDDTLGARNIAFWNKTPRDLGFTILARAGVTSLDRRVFVSYRRDDTSPMADQLFDGLARRNFDVFLDRVSVEVGVNFQEKLFEHLADKSMVVLLHSAHFTGSRWTMAELDFAHSRRLSVLVLRMPGVTDDFGRRLRAGELVQLRDEDVEPLAVDGFQQPQLRLKPAGLAAVLEQIERQHDLELVGRLRDMQARILDAAVSAQLQPTVRPADASVRLSVAGREYLLCAAPRPPALPEMHRASSRVADGGVTGIVVGHVASFPPLRTQQMDWLVKDRNVVYADVDRLSLLMDVLKRGAL